MSKRDEMKSKLNSITSSFIAPPIETKEEVKDDTKEIVNIDKSNVSDNTLTFDATTGNYNKKHNYTITIKIDEDLRDYFENIDKITFIESVKSGKIENNNRTKFINNLIRKEMYKLIKVSDKDDADKIASKWLEYKDKNNL